MPLINFDKFSKEITTLFITGHTFKRINLFQYNPEFAEYFINNLKFYQNKYKIDLQAYTLMPEHYHFQEFAPEEIKIANFLRDLKGYTSRQILWLIKEKDKNYLIGYHQKIIDAEDFEEIKSVARDYNEFAKRRRGQPEINYFRYKMYLFDLGLLITQNNLGLPRIIIDNSLKNKIIRINKTQFSRDIILKVNNNDLLKLLQDKNGYRVFQEQNYKEAIYTQKIFSIKINYIYQNAFKRGLCKKPEEYPYLGGSYIGRG